MPDTDVWQGPSRQDVESGAGRVLLKTLNLNTYKLLYTDSVSEISAYRKTCASVIHKLDKFNSPQSFQGNVRYSCEPCHTTL